jgi:hypothetical protein
MKAANVKALLGSILIVQNYSVLKNLLPQKCRASFKLHKIDRARQYLKQMTEAPEEPVARQSFDGKIEVGMNRRATAFCQGAK